MSKAQNLVEAKGYLLNYIEGGYNPKFVKSIVEDAIEKKEDINSVLEQIMLECGEDVYYEYDNEQFKLLYQKTIIWKRREDFANSPKVDEEFPITKSDEIFIQQAKEINARKKDEAFEFNKPIEGLGTYVVGYYDNWYKFIPQALIKARSKEEAISTTKYFATDPSRDNDIERLILDSDKILFALLISELPERSI